MNFFLSAATSTPLPTPMSQAGSAAAPLYANVPLKWFGIMFLVILAVFLGWYIYMRRRGY